MRTILAFCLLPLLVQEQDPEQLVEKLGSFSFEEQAKAAKALEDMGTKALPALEKAAKHQDAQVQEWSVKIKARIEQREAEKRKADEKKQKAAEASAETNRRRKEILALVEKLGSESFEEQGKAAESLKGYGEEAIPHLREASKEHGKDEVRRWARKLLEAMGDKPDDLGGTEGGNGKLACRQKRDKATEETVLAALRWLARHQNVDGSWSVQKYVGNCKQPLPDGKTRGGGRCAPNPGQDDFDDGVTGLAVLAFLAAGYTQLSKEVHDGISFGDAVNKGISYLLNRQDPEGCVGSRNAQKYMYNHMICAAALSDAYALTTPPKLKDRAQKAVDFAIASQNPGKAWRYSYRSTDNDSSVTGWAVALFKSAELADLKVPGKVYEGVRNWLDEVTEEISYRVGYTHKGTGKVFIPGRTENFDHHETLSAIGILGRIAMNQGRRDGRVSGGSQLLVRDLPKWDGNTIDFYYWYYGSMALYQYDGPGGASWKQWSEKMKDALTKNQNTKATDCKEGSWEPVDRWSGEGGRVYGTAINTLTLLTASRYPKFGR